MADDDQYTIWTEKYRPETFDEIVGHDEIVRRVQSLTEQENLPHLLFAGPPGVGKCVAGNTPVLTGDGSIINIEDLDDSTADTVLSLDENGRVTEQPIEYLYNEESQTLTVSTADGAELTVTPEHPFLTLHDGIPTWKEAQNLTSSDKIAAPNTYTVDDTTAFLPHLTDADREQIAELIGSHTASPASKTKEQLTTYLESDTVPNTLSPSDELTTLKSFAQYRDKWCRAFLDGYVSESVTATDTSYTISTNNEDEATQLAYLLQRQGIRTQQEQETLQITGRNTKNLRTLVSTDLPAIDADSPQTVELAHDHIETVMNTLGIESYTFNNDVRDALKDKTEVSLSEAKYIYHEIYEAARQRLQTAVHYLDTCNDVLDDATFSNKTITEISDARSAALNGHITSFHDLRRDNMLPDIQTVIGDLKQLRGDDAYEQRLSEQSLTYSTSNAIQSFNITLSTLTQQLDQTPVKMMKTGDGFAVRIVRPLYGIAHNVARILETRIYDEDLLESLELIHYLADAEITWDEVRSVSEAGDQRVYDLNVSKTHNFIAGNIPIINHNTTMSLVIAKELYGESWQQNFLELNASDERGIDIVREKVKNFARTQSLGDVPFKIIYLDEADALTSDAQQALRRTMESYTRSCRFILSCNYSSKIIDPIQSRTTVFRFRGLGEDDVSTLITRITEAEGITVTDGGREALLYASDGDLRRLENILQTAASITDEITEDTVYSVASYTDPENVEEILNKAISGSFDDAKDQLLKTMLGQGLSGPDIIKQFQREIWSLDISEDRKLRMIEACGEIEFRLIEGSDEHIQLDALLATFADQG
jgi:replication factor C small subunit